MAEAALRGRTIVLTRPSAGTLGHRLADLGARVEHVPLIGIGPPSDGGVALGAALRDIASFDWIVVTSVNGAEAVGAAAAASVDVRLAAVGATTAAVLAAAAGRPVELVPTTANGDGLLAEFPRTRSRVLLPQASLAGDRLSAGLRAAGHDVVSVEAYTTTPLPPSGSALGTLHAADAVVLASGSAVTALTAGIGDDAAASAAAARAAIVTIGPRTAAVAERHGLTVSAVASSPTDDAVVDAVIAALAVR